MTMAGRTGEKAAATGGEAAGHGHSSPIAGFIACAAPATAAKAAAIRSRPAASTVS